MEGMWTGFIPQTLKIQEWIANDEIGEVKYIDTSFAFPAGYNPNGRLFSKELGGGATLDIGVYTYFFVTHIANAKLLEHNVFATFAESGVDNGNITSYKFEGDIMGNSCCGLSFRGENSAVIYGTKGKIVVPNFWCGTETTHKNNEPVEEFGAGYTNTQYGFVYEAKHFASLVKEGKESDIITNDYVLSFAKYIDEINAKINK